MENIFDIDLSQFSLFKILGLLFYGIIIYLISWLIKNYLIHILIKSPIRKKKVINMLPVVFTLIWTFFTIYVFYFLVRPFPLYGILISLILIYLGRGYLINLVHGMFFRFKGDILIGQKIKIDNHNGEVKVLKTFDLLLENKDGESVIIPYSSLAKQELILQNHSSEFFTHAFSLFTENNLNMELLENEIKKSPWISSVVKSKITKSQSENNQTKYNVIVYSLNEKYNYFIENDLRSFVKDSKLNTNK